MCLGISSYVPNNPSRIFYISAQNNIVLELLWDASKPSLKVRGLHQFWRLADAWHSFPNPPMGGASGCCDILGRHPPPTVGLNAAAHIRGSGRILPGRIAPTQRILPRCWDEKKDQIWTLFGFQILLMENVKQSVRSGQWLQEAVLLEMKSSCVNMY